jgi:hypothetical protein
MQVRWHPNPAPDIAVPLNIFYNRALDELGSLIVEQVPSSTPLYC